MKKFEQLKKLYHTIEGYIDQYDISEAMISGVTADFDRLFELSWKTIKEYLQKEKGMAEARTGSPKDIVKLAYREGILHDENIWLDILEDRNNDSHHYHKSDAILYVSKIQTKYMFEMGKLISCLADRIPEEVFEEVEMPEELLNYCKREKIPIIEFMDQLCERYGYSQYNLVYKNWDQIKAKL